MNVERVTENFRRVKRMAPDWNMIVSPAIYYLAVTDDGKDLGTICFHPCDEEDGLMMHVELSEQCRGKRAARAYKAAFRWMFDNTKCKKLIGRIPSDIRAARIMARHVGAKFVGVDCDGLQCYTVTDTMVERA